VHEACQAISLLNVSGADPWLTPTACVSYLSDQTSYACRQQAATAIKQHYTEFGTWPSTQQLPIVYNEVYNVSFCGIENLHVFDSKKFRKVIAALEEKKLIIKKQVEQLLNLKS